MMLGFGMGFGSIGIVIMLAFWIGLIAFSVWVVKIQAVLTIAAWKILPNRRKYLTGGTAAAKSRVNSTNS